MNTPEISVVMPAYNTGKYLAEGIESVIKQSFQSWELIVVDDGSTDNTAEIVSGFLSDQRILLIRQSNKGVSAARNAGIKAAKGRFVTFLDADDVYLPDNLKIKYESINTDSGIEYIYSDLLVCDAEMNEMFVDKGVSADKVRQAILTWQSENIPGLSSNIMIRHAALKNKNIYFDINLSNCADKYYKILLASYCKGGYIPIPLAKYRNTPNSMSKKIPLLEHDELYILGKVKERNIIPEIRERNKIFAKVYLMLSGSWYKDAGKTGKAMKFAIMAIYTRPVVLFMLLNKGFNAIFSSNKKYI